MSRLSGQKKICKTYERFGDCKFGPNCNASHKGPRPNTRKLNAIILTEYSEIPNVVAFRIELEDGKSRIQRYCIPKGSWFSANASTGDTVEICISEKCHPTIGHLFARVAKKIVMSTEPSLCHDFLTYRNCKWGADCKRSHDTEGAHKQQFLIAEVRSVTSLDNNNLKVEVEVKRDRANQFEGGELYIPSKYSTTVTEGNLVIVQVSSQKNGEVYLGKIITVLSKTSGSVGSEIQLENAVKSSFTFVDPSTDPDAASQRKKFYCYSIEECSKHKNCQKIGVHVPAVGFEASSGLTRLDKFFVPFHRGNNKNLAKGFDVDTIRLALTMYAHTAPSLVEGPILTPLSIDRESVFTYCDSDAPKYQKYVEDLWPIFGHKAFIESVASSLSATYMVDFPNTWKERILVRQMKSFYSEKITKYLMRLKKETFVLVQNISRGIGIAAGDVVIPAENLKKVESAWQSPSSHSRATEMETSLGFLLGSAKRSAEEFWEELVADKYTYGVVSCCDLRYSHFVVGTSPIWRTADFLNQQILLSLMISPTVSLYSKDELLGAITRRHSTPMILKAVIRRLTKSKVYLQLCGVFGRRRGSRNVRLDQIFKCSILRRNSSSQDGSDSGGNDEESVDSIRLVINNLTCQNYCNCMLVCLSGDQIAALAETAIEKGVESVPDVRELLPTRREYDAPYETHEKGTLVTLGRGVELQLQVSLKQDDDVGDNWLRLLRIGKDCHLCLAHLNYPKMAYPSGRADTTSLITESSLKLMKEKITDNSLKTVILDDIAVNWNDDYFSGGSFTAVGEIKARMLLCIRREINGNDNLKFVWTCHAVVSKVSENLVEFLVCSLFQDQTSTMSPETDTGPFIVEVIDVDEENIVNRKQHQATSDC